MTRPFRLLALLLCLALPVLTAAQEVTSDAPIAADDSAGLDARVATRIRDIMAELGGYEDVTVTVNEGIVTFRGEATSLAEAEALTPLANRMEGVVAVRNQVMETADIVRRLNPAVERFRTRLTQVLISLPLVLIALAVFAVIVAGGFALARWQKPWARIAPNAFIAEIYRQLIRIAFVVIGIVVALDILNATALLGTILGAAGIIGLAFGFAVRDTVENFIASVMLSFRQPFGPNDVVEIDGDQGKVIRLTSRATILLSFDGNHIRIPNATVFKSRIVNFSQHPQSRFMFRIGVDLMTDLSRARDLATDTVESLPFVLKEPAVSVWLGEITQAGIELVVTGWIDQRETSLVLARGEALRQVKRALTGAGIDLPDTTYRVSLIGTPAAPDAETPAPADGPPPPPVEADTVAEVAETTEASLDQIVAKERAAKEDTDLLDRRAATE